MSPSTLESLPGELIAEILGHLDLRSLVLASYLSRTLYRIASDSSLNPWRPPILSNLRSGVYEASLKHLSVRTVVPRHNWIEILTLARPSFILFEATLPNLTLSEWEECFSRRFIPGWSKWKKDGTWKEVFLKILFRVWHRSTTSCTSDEAWTRYIVLNRNGSANEVEGSSRHFNPLAIFDEIKAQCGLTHLETRIRVVLELADVRVLAFGTLNQKTPLTYNSNAHAALHPPGIEEGGSPIEIPHSCASHNGGSHAYNHLRYPQPALSFANYPFYTPWGGDRRWLGSGETEEGGLHWVGSMLIVAQILREDNSVGEHVRQQYVSFTWSDLWTIAPWLEEKITKRISGPGLGIE
ncbi:hypothetical protein M378DRAFT_67503 [Amanita muscaria Koide BX008]|uniref:F-box domain-containing protein n=1 Tax=Amanita muscaria (strain Koide BX008) TaxID=946122 RepID=A0A0C2XL51_AMAMK|nr:hypothetical protein M378DRAFT_67503 [Amanita muscaria Koide BX008]